MSMANNHIFSSPLPNVQAGGGIFLMAAMKRRNDYSKQNLIQLSYDCLMGFIPLPTHPKPGIPTCDQVPAIKLRVRRRSDYIRRGLFFLKSSLILIILSLELKKEEEKKNLYFFTVILAHKHQALESGLCCNIFNKDRRIHPSIHKEGGIMVAAS